MWWHSGAMTEGGCTHTDTAIPRRDGSRMRKGLWGDIRACEQDGGPVCQGWSSLAFKGKHTFGVAAVIPCVTVVKAVVQIKQGSSLCRLPLSQRSFFWRTQIRWHMKTFPVSGCCFEDSWWTKMGIYFWNPSGFHCIAWDQEEEDIFNNFPQLRLANLEINFQESCRKWGLK